MNKAIIVPNSKKDVGLEVTAKVVKRLSTLGITSVADFSSRELSAYGAVISDKTPEDADVVIVVGGDGSLIDASKIAINLSIPILGVNMGKVGYLSEIDPDSLDMLDRLVSGDYQTEERMLLTAKKDSVGGEESICDRLAVNDVVVSHDGYLGIADFKITNRKGDTVSYRADGLILSTAQGSTAYSLSAGGPIVAHNLDTIIMTPICPHSLFNRSIIFEPDECIRIQNTGSSPLNISLDGRLFSTLDAGDFCTVKRAQRRLKTVIFSENNMFSTLFRKIKVLEE